MPRNYVPGIEASELEGLRLRDHRKTGIKEATQRAGDTYLFVHYVERNLGSAREAREEVAAEFELPLGKLHIYSFKIPEAELVD